MSEFATRSMAYKGNSEDRLETIRRAFREFLTLPTGIIIGFLLVAAGTFVLDRTEIAWLEPIRAFLKTQVFTEANATSDLLSTIAGGLITVTSITISLLLLALQQTSATLTPAVCDQFLLRRLNQFSFGFFVGLSLFALITLATVSERFNPVFGATLVFLLTAVALYLLILLLYTTINQMRPVEIIEEIHRLTLLARARQLAVVRKTRRASCCHDAISAHIKAAEHGYVTGIDIEAIGEAARRSGDHVEVVLSVSIGSFVACHDAIAHVKGPAPDETTRLEQVVQGAVHLERQRNLVIDPAYGIEQLEMIAWTSISTAKSDPAPGLVTIRSLRDVLSRWSVEDNGKVHGQPLPVVYTDNTFVRLMDVFETFAIVSSESMQHQIYIEVLHTLTSMFDRLSIDRQRRVEDIILRILSALGDHVLTAELDAALSAFIRTLQAANRVETADAIHAAQEQLRRSVGRLNSRSTRAAPK